MAGNSISFKWDIISGDPNLIFYFPPDTPSHSVRVYHGVSANVPNRQMFKSTRRNITAGNVVRFRNVGSETERVLLDIILMTYEEALTLVNFFKNTVRSGVFYYLDSITGVSNTVRLLNAELSLGQGAGAPYSVSLLMKKETPYVGNSVTFSYNIIQTISTASVIVGSSFSSLLFPTNSNYLYSTGDNSAGQLGLSDSIDRVRFERVGAETTWESGSACNDALLMLKEDGTLWTSGNNSYGQLGLDYSTYPFSVDLVQVGVDTWSRVSGGRNSSYGVKTNGSLWAWGQNNFGQLGQGSNDSSVHDTPLQIGSDTDWEDVYAGTDFVIAKKTNGELWGCGADGNGQLGQGSIATMRTSLVKIGSDTNWSRCSLGWAHTVALKTDGSLYAWGANSKGELGDGSVVDKWTPTKIGSDIWSYIAAGGDGGGTTYGIKADGTLWVWGFNENYELGIGSADSNPHSSPIQLSSDTDWTKVEAGGAFGMAVKNNTVIWGWGINVDGEIGVGYSGVAVTVPTKTFLFGNQIKLKWQIQFFPFPP